MDITITTLSTTHSTTPYTTPSTTPSRALHHPLHPQGGNASMCGLWSRYHLQVSTPLLLLGSQLDPQLLARQACIPDQVHTGLRIPLYECI